MKRIADLYNTYQDLSEIEKHLLVFESNRSEFESIKLAHIHAIEVNKVALNSKNDLFFKLASNLERALGLISDFSIIVNDDTIEIMLECVENLWNMITNSVHQGKSRFDMQSLILGLKNFYYNN